MFYQWTTKQMKTCNNKTLFFHAPIIILNMNWHPLQATYFQKHTDRSVDTSNTEVKNDTEKTLTVNNWMFVKKQAEYLSVNIDPTKFFALIFADWRAAQTSTKDI